MTQAVGLQTSRAEAISSSLGLSQIAGALGGGCRPMVPAAKRQWEGLDTESVTVKRHIAPL